MKHFEIAIMPSKALPVVVLGDDEEYFVLTKTQLVEIRKQNLLSRWIRLAINAVNNNDNE